MASNLSKSRAQMLKEIIKSSKESEMEAIPSAEVAKMQMTAKEFAEYKEKKIKLLASDCKILEVSYCRMCGKYKNYSFFLPATSHKLDKNGKMSICTTCLNNMLKEYYTLTADYYQSFSKMCKDIDIKYDEGSVARVIKFVDENPGSQKTPFLKYWEICINPLIRKEQPAQFSDSTLESALREEKIKRGGMRDAAIKWGENFSASDYEYLENRFQEYSEAFGVVYPSERDALKTLCLLLLRQRLDPANPELIKALTAQYNLMGISPSTLRKENKDKGAKTLGIEIAIMEQTEPAEYVENQKLYFDHDGLSNDIKEIKRAIKNHLTGSRDFECDGIDISEILNDSLDLNKNGD